MKNHYRYYQRSEKTAWIPVEAENAERDTLNDGGVRLTVLATNTMLGGLDGTAAPRDLKYYGPLYFDIDHGDDLPLAINSANRLIKMLVDDYGMEERDIEAYLSGKKGLHVFIQPEQFGLTRSVLRLPKVFMEMAVRLYVSGMDMQVYSTRNAFRLANVQREDGRYRVRVSPKELRTMTQERYLELTEKPRTDYRPPRPSGKVYTQLAVLFEQCQELARRNERPASDSAQVYSPQLQQHFSEDLPPCILHLAEGKRAETKTFNEAAFQVAIFSARLNPDGLGTFEPTFHRIADAQTSTNYATSRSRIEHMEGLYNYMRHTDRNNFSCNAMRSVLKSRVCSECVLEATKLIETPEDAAKVVGLESRVDGYFDVSGKAPRRLATFRLVPDYVFSEHTDDGQVRRIGTMTTVETNGAAIGQVLLDESAWTNRSAFLRALNGVGNVSFFGTESDIQKVKYVTLAESDLPERTMVTEMGMHVTRQSGKEVRTFVARNSSINNVRMTDTMVFHGGDKYDPYLLRDRLEAIKPEDDEAIDALKILLTMNEPEVMAILVGWATACHVKPHIMHHFRQFPLVNMWGNRGNGKTTISRFVCAFAGCDFVSEFEEMNIPVSTPFAWTETLSNSTSVPVLWDEVNKSGQRMPLKAYAKVCELLKAAWNGQVALKGTLNQTGKAAALNSYRLVRPVIYCSEQKPEMPALLDRSISILTTEKALHKFDGKDFQLRAKLDGLKRMAYTLTLSSLMTPSKDIASMLEGNIEKLPKELRNRPRYSLAVCLTGLEWLQQVLEDRQIVDEELTAMLDEAHQAILDRGERESAEEATKQISSEVDRVFAEIFELIDHGLQAMDGDMSPSQVLLRPGVNFQSNRVGTSHILFLDARGAHSAYLQYARRKGINVILDELRVFCELALQEDYIKGLDKNPTILNGRHVFRIDLGEAERRGLPTYYLGDPDEF